MLDPETYNRKLRAKQDEEVKVLKSFRDDIRSGILVQSDMPPKPRRVEPININTGSPAPRALRSEPDSIFGTCRGRANDIFRDTHQTPKSQPIT